MTGERDVESPPAEKKESFLDSVVREFARRGLTLFVVLFLAEVVLFFVVVMLPFLPGEQAFYTSQSSQLNSEFAGVSWLSLFWGIFTNNFRIALFETVPGVGPALFAFSLYETARVLQVTAISDQTSPILVVILLLLLFPHSWIELPAYAVATGESLYLVYGLYKAIADGLRREKFDPVTGRSRVTPLDRRVVTGIGQYLLALIIIAAMLLVAALFESTEIELGALYFWVTWVPFAGLIALTVTMNNRLKRLRKKDEEKPAVYPMVIQ